LATGCGYSYRDIDGMTLAEAEEVFGYWERHPPVYQLTSIIAQMLGWKPSRATDDSATGAADWDSLAGMPGMGEGKSPLAAAAVLDFDELRRQHAAAGG